MNKLKVSVSPHIHSGVTTQKIMLDVIIALVPAAVAGCIIFGIRSLFVMLTSVAAAVIAELLFCLACKREIAYIPDNPDIYEFMTGAQYLTFISDIFGIREEDRKARTEKYSSLFELTSVLGQPISSYSHGMRQKLAIISAWIHEPKLILLDEPFVGLDPKASHILKEMMREHCDAGGAIFFSTHVLEVAEKLCDRIAIIKGGKLIRTGTTEEIIGDESLEAVFLELEGE